MICTFVLNIGMLGNSKCLTLTKQTGIAVAALYAKYFMKPTKSRKCSVKCEHGISFSKSILLTSSIVTMNTEESMLMV
jgi:hypothetical protein